MIKKEIANWLNNQEAVALYRQGMSLIEKSGILSVLFRLGIPNLIHLGADANIMASQASWSNGYQTALEQLRYFEELFKGDAKHAVTAIEPDFGGLAEAVRRGDMTSEEAKKFQ